MTNPMKFECSTCGDHTWSDADDADAWNGEFCAGILVAILCPLCQTGEQNAEAAINEATLDHGVDAFGRSVMSPKVRIP